MWRKILFNILLISVIAFLLSSCKIQKDSQVQMITLLETTESWIGAELPDYRDGKPKITMLKAIIPPGVKLNVHKHPVINAAMVLKGKLTVITEQKDTLIMREGDAFTEVVDTWHYGMNTGKRTVEIIIFYAGVEGMENTVLK